MTRCLTCSENKTGKEKEQCKENGHDLDYENMYYEGTPIVENEVTPQQTSSKKNKIMKSKASLKDSYIESVYINNKPCFLQVTNDIIKAVNDVITENEIIVPFTKERHPYAPYIISHKREILELDTLLDRTEKIIDNCIVMPKRDKIILLANIAISYSLEWVNSLHYLAFIGDTGSGKTSALKIAEMLMYRPLFGGNISHANVFRFLGKDEEGMGTILEDEIQSINKDHDKISAYKIGYTRGAKIPKINMNKKEQDQDYWITWSPKIFAGEALPKDRGLLERIVPIYMIQGKPKFDINRLNPEQKQEIESLRADWLLYKLKHLSRPQNTHDLEISGRNAQLFEDYLILFSETKFYESLKNAVLYYVEKREDIIHDKLEARIYRATRKVMKNNTASMSNIWEQIKKDIAGIKQGEFSYELEEGDTISKTMVSKILIEKFRAQKNRNSKERFFIFKPEVIEQLDEKYGRDTLD